MRNLTLISTELISACILINYPAYAEQIWLNCGTKQNAKNINYEQPFIINLNSGKERFEIVEEENEKIQGKATFFTTAIKFSYNLQRVSKVWEIDRTNLSYTRSVSLEDTKTTIYTGICKIIPPPPKSKNLI